MRVGIDSYSYHRLYGELRAGEDAPATRSGPVSHRVRLRTLGSIGADDIFLETCYLPEPEDDRCRDARGRGSRPRRLQLGPPVAGRRVPWPRWRPHARGRGAPRPLDRPCRPARGARRPHHARQSCVTRHRARQCSRRPPHRADAPRGRCRIRGRDRPRDREPRRPDRGGGHLRSSTGPTAPTSGSRSTT